MLCGHHAFVPHTAGVKHGRRRPPCLPCRRGGACVPGALGRARRSGQRRAKRLPRAGGQGTRGQKRTCRESMRQGRPCRRKRYGRGNMHGSRRGASKAASRPSRRPDRTAVPCGGARQRRRAASNKRHGGRRGASRARLTARLPCAARSACRILFGNRSMGGNRLPSACDGGGRGCARREAPSPAFGGLHLLGSVCDAAPARDGRGATHSLTRGAGGPLRACHGGTRGANRPPGTGRCSTRGLRRHMLCARRARHLRQRLGDTGIFPYDPRNKHVGNVGEPSVLAPAAALGVRRLLAAR